jgi:hypothetical protein
MNLLNYQKMAAGAEGLYDGPSLDASGMTRITSLTLPCASPPAVGETSGNTAATFRGLLALVPVLALLGAVGCEGAAPVVDASTPPSALTSAVSLRIDVPADKPASLTVLAFRAAFSGVQAADVLGLVDPLAAPAPLRDCQLRDIGQATAALVARGDAIELEELLGIGISLINTTTEIHPSPRLYPDLAATIGGVVAEAGPLGLATVPQQVRVQNGAIPVNADGSPDATTIAVPTTGWIKLLNGTVPRNGSRVEVGADLNLNLATGAPLGGGDVETSIELRPFGTTAALSCLVPADAEALPSSGGQIAFVIPRQALTALVGMSGATPGAPVAAGLDLVRRSSQRLPLSAARVAVEVRTSTFVELRP